MESLRNYVQELRDQFTILWSTTERSKCWAMVMSMLQMCYSFGSVVLCIISFVFMIQIFCHEEIREQMRYMALTFALTVWLPLFFVQSVCVFVTSQILIDVGKETVGPLTRDNNVAVGCFKLAAFGGLVYNATLISKFPNSWSVYLIVGIDSASSFIYFFVIHLYQKRKRGVASTTTATDDKKND